MPSNYRLCTAEQQFDAMESGVEVLTQVPRSSSDNARIRALSFRYKTVLSDFSEDCRWKEGANPYATETTKQYVIV